MTLEQEYVRLYHQFHGSFEGIEDFRNQAHFTQRNLVGDLKNKLKAKKLAEAASLLAPAIHKPTYQEQQALIVKQQEEAKKAAKQYREEHPELLTPKQRKRLEASKRKREAQDAFYNGIVDGFKNAKPESEEESACKRAMVREALYGEGRIAKANAEAVAEGIARAEAGEGLASYTMNERKPSKLRMKRKLKKLLAGGNMAISASDLFDNINTMCCNALSATGSFSWSSGNTNIATIAKTGTDTATSSTATATGVTAGNVTISCTYSSVDEDGNPVSFTADATLIVTASSKPHISKAVVGLSNSVATSGVAFSSTASCTCTPPDISPATYTYQYFFSGPSNGLSIDMSSGVISGVPVNTVATTLDVGCTVKDSYGTAIAATKATITLNAPATNYPHVPTTPTGCTADGSWNGSNKHGVYQHRLFHSGIPAGLDDGSFKYEWGWNGAAPNGLSYDTPTSSDSYVSGTATAAGTFHGICTVTDWYGNSVVNTWTDTIG